MANLITLSRLILLLLAIVIAYVAPPVIQLVNVPLLILVFATDGIDGYVARRRNETSVFGAMFDIAADRVVEYSLWIVYAHLGLVPVWVPLLFVVRGSIVDAIRAEQVSSRRESPFGMIRTALGRFLVAGKFMRGLYAVWKAAAFVWLALVLPLPALAPELWAEHGGWMSRASDLLIWGAAAMCLLRGLPVVIEFMIAEFRAVSREESAT